VDPAQQIQQQKLAVYQTKSPTWFDFGFHKLDPAHVKESFQLSIGDLGSVFHNSSLRL
jgi:hypothetical protein